MLSQTRLMHVSRSDSKFYSWEKKPNGKNNYHCCNLNTVKSDPALFCQENKFLFHISPKIEQYSCSKFYDIGKEYQNYSTDAGQNLKERLGKNSERSLESNFNLTALKKIHVICYYHFVDVY